MVYQLIRAAFALVLVFSTTAFAQRFMDSDQDRISDELEIIFGLDEQSKDPDRDGYTDFEEYARFSDPKNSDSTPSFGTNIPSTRILVRSDGVGGFLVSLLVYLPQSKVLNAQLHFGAVLDMTSGANLKDHTIAITPELYTGIDSSSHFPGLLNPSGVTFMGGAPVLSVVERTANGDGELHLWEIPIDDSQLELFGQSQLLALVTTPDASGIHSVEAVGSAYLVAGQGGETYQASFVQSDQKGFASGVTASKAMVATLPMDDIPFYYRPLEPAPLPGPQPGKLCAQSTQVVGSIGGQIIMEVIKSSCETADGFCKPTCHFEVGKEIEVLDPLGLIGG